MSRRVGYVTIEYYPQPRGAAYEFIEELMWIKVFDCFMSGMGRVWTYFSFSEIMRYADDFVENEGLTQEERDSITVWLETLPWDGWDNERYIELYLED